MQNNDFYTKPSNGENRQQDEVDLGTFKSVKTLKDAYDSLRKVFTQNAMELAKYKKDENETAFNENSQNSESEEKNTKNSEKIEKNDEKTANFTQKSEILENTNTQENTEPSDKVDSTPDPVDSEVDKVLAPTLNRFESEEWQEKVQNFFLENEDARQHASEIGRIIMQNENVRNSVDPLDKAWIKVLKNNVSTPLDNAKIEEYILQNETIRQKIIEQYLSELQHKKSAPKVISERGGTQPNATKSPHPLSMAEAKELAKKIMIK